MRFRRVLCAALAAAAVGAAAGRASGADVRAAMVEFAGPRGPIKGYLARPGDAAAYPPILMVHESWGLTPWIKGNAERLAARGYAVLAVDLFGGKSTADPAVAAAFARAVDVGLAVEYLRLGARYLLAQRGIDVSHKLGAIGWGLGATLAREFAQASDLVGPVALCYGGVTTRAADVGRLVGKPVLGIFGAQDSTVRPDQVERFGELLAERMTPFNFKVYPNAAHAFMRPGEPNYSPDDARPAWVAIEEFFSVYLHGEP
jgi:carboxymethylenebutenolidase